jgi:hypothetical protein
MAGPRSAALGIVALAHAITGLGGGRRFLGAVFAVGEHGSACYVADLRSRARCKGTGNGVRLLPFAALGLWPLC